ncbi:hypothetical protein M427DRAFT_135229 [Gonapodya prolifera JEL478]|uniref:SnoaL-like domain-containing protein n=1 Tax=Gonapodya prolifera (strain JEL478) TaxID=1344416 RepID=A0A139AF09_GONPJ|nr:hypothetical protein M427DRAFT_135229 [Gonapodya prolifera JEL478]|eukprot:KXS15269.1 hypothetical protein M427DRAFT_135229 [Gonapodya prolifera JEL478]
MSTLDTNKKIFRKDFSADGAGQLPVDVAPVERRLPTTERGRRAYHIIKTAYERFFSMDEYWEMYTEGATTYFGANSTHLKRYPRDTRLFWAVFGLVIAHGMEEVTNNTTVDLVVWDTGYAFTAYHCTYKTMKGTTWSGMVLTRMKFNEEGRVYDQAFFTEDARGLDAVTGELMELPQVREKILLECGLNI